MTKVRSLLGVPQYRRSAFDTETQWELINDFLLFVCLGSVYKEQVIVGAGSEEIASTEHVARTKPALIYLGLLLIKGEEHSAATSSTFPAILFT